MKQNKAETAFWRTVTCLFLVSGLAVVGCQKKSAPTDKKADKPAFKAMERKPEPKKGSDSSMVPGESTLRDVRVADAAKAEEMEKSMDSFAVQNEVGGGGGGGGRRARRAAPRAPMAMSLQKSKKKGGKKRAVVKTWKRAKSIPNTSRLKIGDNQELPLQGMQATVHVDGFRARVLLDCYFLNDRNRQYEGTFQVRLPNDAAPYFFAFGESTWAADDSNIDKAIFQSQEQAKKMGTSVKEVMIARQKTWNKPKEARMVPKAKAAYAYKETVRQRVDPALMEWAGAGVFNARVFPLAPKKIHRIVIGYDVNLLPVGSGLEYRLDIPSKKSKCVVDLFVKSLAGADVTIEPKAEADKAGGNLYYRFEKANLSRVVLRYNASGPVLLRGNDPKIGDTFAATFEAPIPETENLAGNDHAVFLVDTSLSGNPERFNVWLKMLGALLENNRSTMKKFNVLFFNIETFWWKPGFQDNTESNVKALLKYADNLALEGATDLGAALREGCAPKWSEGPSSADCFLLSDGAITWGESEQYGLSNILKDSKTTLFAYKTGFAGTNQALLTHLTRESGGSVFSVVGEAQIASASVAHKKRPWVLESISMKNGEDLLLAGRPQCLFPGQQLILAGRGKGSDIVTIKARQGKTKKTFQVNIPKGSQLNSSLASRVYGQIAVSQIEDFNDFKSVSGIAKAYAIHFRVTGRSCSLLMLESEADYKRFNIKPEEEAFVVKSSPAAKTVANALDKIGAALGNPKLALMRWIERMKETPGVKFNFSKSTLLALESLDKSAFSVPSKALRCKNHSWDGIPGKFQEQLSSTKIKYDDVTAESLARKKKYGAADALKALSSLVEKNPGDGVLARDVGYSAMEWGLSDQAYHLFRRVAKARPFEPQSYRAMAQCLAGMDRNDLAIAYYEMALAGQWDSRFGAFRRIVGLDYLRFLNEIKRGRRKAKLVDYVNARQQNVAKEFGVGEAGMLVTITWNTDATDIDLHVKEPGGEVCYYEHNKTASGGSLTQDVTQGYGPEMYLSKNPPKGTFKIMANYYSSNRNRAGTRTKVYATVYRNWGTDKEEVFSKVITLKEGKQLQDITFFRVN